MALVKSQVISLVESSSWQSLRAGVVLLLQGAREPQGSAFETLFVNLSQPSLLNNGFGES